MKRLLSVAATIAFVGLAVLAISPSAAGALSVFMPKQGGTGSYSVPAFGQVLVGTSGGVYAPRATSTLGLPTFSGANSWTGYNSFATTTVSVLNGVVVVNGTNFLQSNTGINAALSYCGASAACNTVQLAPGNYGSITAELNVPSNVTLSCSGPTSPLLLNNSDIRLFGVANANVRNCYLDGANNTASLFTEGIFVNNSKNIHIDHNTLVNQYAFGVFIDALSNSINDGIWVDHNNLTCLSGNDCIGGGSITSNNASSTIKNIFIDHNVIAQAAGGSTDFNCLDFDDVGNVQITNNICQGNLLFGNEQQPHVTSIIQGNTVSPAAGQTRCRIEIDIIGTATSTGNILNVSGNTGNHCNIVIDNETSIPLTNVAGQNNILDASGIATSEAGMLIKGVKGGVFTGNIIASSTGDGIHVTNTTFTSVTDNTITNPALRAIEEDLASNDNVFSLNRVGGEGATSTYVGSRDVVSGLSGANTGFGTLYPRSILEVNGDARVDSASAGLIIDDTASPSVGGSIRLRSNSDSDLFAIGFGGPSGSHGNDFHLERFNASAWTDALVIVNASGNVGVGTSTPGSALAVGGVANFSAATSTFYSGVSVPSLAVGSLSGIMKAVGGYVTTALVNLTTDVTGILPIANGGTNAGSQTANGVAYFDGTKVTTGAGLTFTGSSFGVGTTSPSATFAVAGDATIKGASGGLRLQDPSSGNPVGGSMRFADSGFNDKWAVGLHNSSGTSISGSLFFSYLNGGWSTLLALSQSGLVGVGTSTPAYTLDLYGGGLRLAPGGTGQPTCSATARGLFWVTNGASGVKDTVQVCAKDASDAYAWRTIY